MKLLLVCSAGGQFRALHQLTDFWSQHERVWVTLPTDVTRHQLDGETVVWAHGPTHRNIPNLLRNLGLAFKVLLRERPDLVISTGTAVAVPFIGLARVLGSRTVFIESITRTRSLSLSARLCLPFLSRLYVHWPQLQALHPRSILIEH
ncbi:UDP-N-acetylglucosamine--LPS N-acetylglucosamine transferase [Synechococcus sp. RSCCF101]|uniref:UDP-N-acetylglucosamine--LPS N-acetylglucosamine transferase n=1 Tax=Synechococcus sp. RSCCF101 TaxID=2511069 RepID=UPI0012476ABB|nr:UDP-N-acetylglucosamine--LPS N-acetylglucosamine transferase [Synechococcus sp. RSCCF101]QEY31478.1 UDP-N-acetylglucosamine--LPS N-acetylglucosamine transferase [Synechococcus sp. RSCCF101]